MPGYLLPLMLLLVAPAITQPVVKQRIISNGYENGRLVRNHVVAKYYHYSPTLTDGFVLILKPRCFSNEPYSDSVCVSLDTLCRFRGNYRNNRPFGTFLFFPRDNVFYRETYAGYLKNGICIGFYDNGTVHSQVMYRKGIPVGTSRKYYANGNLAEWKKLYKKPLNLTEYQSYYVTGKMFCEGMLYGERKINEWKYYSPDGTLTKMEYYTPRGRLLAVRPEED